MRSSERLSRVLLSSVVLVAVGCHEGIECLSSGPGLDEPDGGGATALLSSADLSAGQYHTCATSSGSMLCWGENGGGTLGLDDDLNRPGATPVGDRRDWVQVSAGERATCARTLGGAVFC